MTMMNNRQQGRTMMRETVSNVNVGLMERYFSLMSGLALMVLSRRQRGVRSFLMGLLAGQMLYRGSTGHDPLYQTFGITTAVKTNPQNVSVPHRQGVHVSEQIVINRPADEIYRFWRNLENLPRFMRHLQSVRIYDDKRSHWVAKAPLNMQVEWDSEIVNDIPGEVLAWRSLPTSQIANAGAVRFTPTMDGSGTTVRIELEYVPPAGALGQFIATILGEEPRVQVADDLRLLKQLVEVTNAIPSETNGA